MASRPSGAITAITEYAPGDDQADAGEAEVIRYLGAALAR